MNRVSLSIFILILLTFGTFATIGNHQTGQVPAKTRQAGLGHLPLLGIDCGLGSTQAALNASGFPVAQSETGVFVTRSSCTWIGDVGNSTGPADKTTEPLVTDQDESLSTISTKIGGGFTANVVYIENGTSSLNGFDVTVSYNPGILHAVAIDQGGLEWTANSPFTALSKIDNNLGTARLAQVITSPLSANLTLFRIRFDVVGVGITSLSINNDVIANPGIVIHQTVNGAFDSESYFDPGHKQNWIGIITSIPTPLVPGQPSTFNATVACASCTLPLHYKWDFNSDGKIDATANPATITLPNPSTTANRLTLVVYDSAPALTQHNITIVERLPLTANVNGPGSIPVNTSETWNATWIGGIPNYIGSWRFCPGSTLVTTVCAKPSATIASTPGQTNLQTLNSASPPGAFHFGGMYHDTLTIIDAGSPVLAAPTQSAFPFVVNVTGPTQAYNVTVTTSAAGTGGTSTINANIAYATSYPATLRASQFSYTINFGDSMSASVTGPASLSVPHVYVSPGTYTVQVVAVENNGAASKIQETGTASITIAPASFDFSVSLNPGNGSVGSGGGTNSTVVTVNTGTGTPQTVTLTTTPSITGVTVTFNQTSHLTTFHALMTVTVSPSATPGTYAITVKGTSTSGISHTAVYSLTIGGSPPTGKPIIGVWSNHYSSANITDTSLTAGSYFNVQINVTNAPLFNGYEFVLYYDPNYLNVSSYDVSTNTLFSNSFIAPGSDPYGPGAFRLQVVDLGQSIPSGSGMLANITFKILKMGVSPLVLAAGTALPSNFAAAPTNYCSASCPAGAPNWTRLVHGSTPLDVSTSNGYFRNVAGNPGPVASFTYSPSNPSQGIMITFDASNSFDPDNPNTNNHGISQYIWDFGDRSPQPTVTTFTPTVSHSFAQGGGYPTTFLGNFSIRLIVVDTDQGFQGMKVLLLTISPSALHDVGITGLLVPSPIPAGQNASMLVFVTNLGTYTEMFNLTLTYGLQNITFVHLSGQTIATGQTSTFPVSLNTMNLAPGFYRIIATVSDPLDTSPSNNVAVAQLQIIVPDEPPTASFTFSPAVPVAQGDVRFNGTQSADPDGMIQIWNWNFGDGYVSQYYGYPYTDHFYSSPGNYTVTLTVTDSSGKTASTAMIIRVLPRPQHDLGLLFVNAYPSLAVSGQKIVLEADVVNTGSNSSTADLTFYYNGKVAVVQRGLLIPFTLGVYYVDVQWDTTGIAAGNYTLSATIVLTGTPTPIDPTPLDNMVTGGQLTLLPPPVLTLVPNSGPVGTLVQVRGSGFPNLPFYYYPVEIEMTFDNQLTGLFFIQSSSFNFSFDVPDAQTGPHTVHAVELFGLTLDVQAVFTVTATPSAINLAVSVGTVYFPGDTATIYVMTSINGQLSPVGTLQVILIRPDGTNLTINAISTATGLYKATYAIPSTGLIGTYAVTVKAHQTPSGDGSALATFEVKPSWISSNSRNITTGVAITGLVGVTALAWRKGYFRKNDEEETLNADKAATSPSNPA